MTETGSTQGTNTSDADLVRRVVIYLTARGVRRANLLHVKARSGVVVLQGRMDSMTDRDLCISCCQRVAGVLHVIDELSVADTRNVNWRGDRPAPTRALSVT